MKRPMHSEIAISAMWCAGFTEAEAIWYAQQSMPSLPSYLIRTVFDSQNAKLSDYRCEEHRQERRG